MSDPIATRPDPSGADASAQGRPDPAPLMALATAYWGAQTLLTANRLGLFALLAGRALDTAAIAAELGSAPRQTGLLLRACAGLGLLQATAAGFRNSPLAEAYLVPGRPGYLGDALGYSHDLYPVWGRLGESVVSGRPALPAETYLGRDHQQTRHFVLGMHNRALAIGRALVGLVDLGERQRLLDVGGGPGTYAALFAERHPRLSATVLDLPEVVAIAAEVIAGMGRGSDLAARVATLPGDYTTTPWPGGNDCVLISGVFHRETETRCQELIARAHAALVPGGLLILSDVFCDEDGTTPPFAALFGLNMMLTAADGGVHSDAAVAGWMAQAGFGQIARHPFPPPMPHRVVTGVRP